MLKEFFGRNKEQPQRIMTSIVSDLLIGNKISQTLSPEDEKLVDEINKMKGTRFNTTEGPIISVIQAAAEIKKITGQDFNLQLLHSILEKIMNQNGTSVNLNNLLEVDNAWKRYLNPQNLISYNNK